MTKKELIAVLEEIGTLLELKGENPFKCRAYYNAARSLEGEQAEPRELLESGRLSEIKGIGKGLQEKITELVATGRLPYYEQLRSEFPDTLLELLKIPGMGPKKVKAVYDKLGIRSVGELEYACNENRLVALDGFGEKSQAKILAGIEMLKRFQGRYLYRQARAEADTLLEALAGDGSGVRISICGSLRRSKEIIRDIDLLVSTKAPAALMKRFTSLPQVYQVIGHGETKSSIVLTSGIQADLRAVTDEQFPYALNYFTGSKAHNTALRARAKKKGLKLNEYGLFRGERLLRCKDEEELYAKLGLHYVPPELREDTGEIEAAAEGTLPHLIEAGLDAINPVQISCRGMEARALKRDFGDRLTLWGGGCDTHKTLAFATPDAIRRHVREQVAILEPGGGFVFQQVHNILADVPPENVVAMFDAVNPH